MEREHSTLKTKNDDLQCLLERRDSYIQKLETRLRNLERKQDDASKQLRETERERRDLDSRVNYTLIQYSVHVHFNFVL